MSATIENRTINTMQALQEELSSLSKVVLQNHMALDISLASQEGVCSVINDLFNRTKQKDHNCSKRYMETG